MVSPTMASGSHGTVTIASVFYEVATNLTQWLLTLRVVSDFRQWLDVSPNIDPTSHSTVAIAYVPYAVACDLTQRFLTPHTGF